MARINSGTHSILLVSFLAVVLCHMNTPPFPDQQQQHHHQQQAQQNQQHAQQGQQIHPNQHAGQQQFQQQQGQFQPGQAGDNVQFQGGQQGEPGMHAAQGRRFHDPNHVQDKDHIMEHLDGVIKTKEEMTPDELQFHYFKVHDYDNNNVLDGIELMAALTHFHREEGHSDASYKDEELSELIDDIMKEDDLNDDGYIDYAEFVNSQQRSD